MMRPFAGQRNFGSAPVPSASLAASLSSVSGAGVTTLALCGGSFGLTTADTAGFACAAGAGALAFAAGAAAPGITRRSPTLSVALAWRLLALMISLTGLWYWRAILLSVSPAATTWTPELPAAPVAALAAAAGAGAGGRATGAAAAATVDAL